MSVVVIWFQNSYLCGILQQETAFDIAVFGCNLVSKFLPLWYLTTGDIDFTGVS